LLLLFGLAPKRVFNAMFVTNHAVSSYPTFSPLPLKKGGILSVALSLGFRLPGVTWFYLPAEPGLSS
tara:strand:+ start:128 stop:328 length:201 start_codon:yes stop_codon:yes gene_type:complete